MNFWLTVLTGISDPRLCLVFDVHSLHTVICVPLRQESKDWILLDKVQKKTPLDLQKRFPKNHSYSKYLAACRCGLAFPQNGLAFRQDHDKVEKNDGWLGTWDSPLRTDSASLKSLESFIQLTSFCSSWILAVSSRIVSRSSINFLLENPSNVDPWNRFNSSISLRLFIWASRRSRFCSNNSSWRSCWSRRSCSSPARVWSISLRWDSIIPSNSWILLLSESAWNSCFWISDLTSARICSSCLSRRILVLSFSISRLDFRFWHELSSNTGLTVLVCVKKDWAGNKLSSSEW